MSSELWKAKNQRDSSFQINGFMESVNDHYGKNFEDVRDLHAWSCRHGEDFWRHFWNFYKIGRPYKEDERVICAGEGADASYRLMTTRFFPEETLNAAEILLRDVHLREEALVFYGEGGKATRLSGAELQRRVANLAYSLQERGVGVGDRVAAFMPNIPETVIGFLASASLGAIWSSCSPDFGVEATLSRLKQVEPKVLLCADGYMYGGKSHEVYDKILELCSGLPSLEMVVLTGFLDSVPDEGRLSVSGLEVVVFDSCCEGEKQQPSYAMLPFDHPLVIAFSSGTTGVPKCIVHRAGGLVVNWIKEHRLHCNIGFGDRVFYFTTCGWMMWNWLVGSLASGATLILYDGHPLPRDDEGFLFSLAARERLTFFGTSARYLQTLYQKEYRALDCDLSSLRTVASTGSPLAPEVFGYVYDSIKEDVHLASISGGTDIMGCFLLGSPTLPVRAGQLQMGGLGMEVAAYDEDGHKVEGVCGELVACTPFPNQPLGFWHDSGAERYRSTYYERFPGVWHHGDLLTEVPGEGFVIHGRSDTVLNPGGVRIGSSEVRDPVERMEEVVEAVAVGHDMGHDERIILFVVLREGKKMDEVLKKRMCERIRHEASPRHMPALVVEVEDIPRTLSGKVSEVAIRDLINGRDVTNRDALANPESLEVLARNFELFGL